MASVPARSSSSASPAATRSAPRWAWLPAPDTWKYHALLAAIGLLVLGPLGGLAASYMNFSIGFYVGGQVLAGILGSTVTYGYGADGRHGANYIQTIAASVAGMSAMAVVLQAMTWLGIPQPPVWKAMAYLTCIGMFGVGVGMLLTPIVVDRMQLPYPSGLAVANILRALTDPVLLRRSVLTLGSGIGLGWAGGVLSAKVALIGRTAFSASTLGAGMIVGARIGLPTIAAGLTGLALQPYFVSIGWLHADDPVRKITFLIGLGLILGASIVDLTLIAWEAVRRLGAAATAARAALSGAPGADAPPVEAWKRTNTKRLLLWVAFWAAGVVLSGNALMGVPLQYMIFTVLLVFALVLVIGISTGLTDSSPISSAFVVTVLLLASLGLHDPAIGMVAATVMLVACAEGADMQQDRSTGWRLGTNRTIQFRYQVAGILVGAAMAIVYARLFMTAYPVLALDQTAMTADQQPAAWVSAMTYKFVGVLRTLTDDKPYQRHAIWLGIAIGFAVQVFRLWLRASPAYRRFATSGPAGRTIDFLYDAIVLPSPYAYAFGTFFNLATSLWFGAGSVLSTLHAMWKERAAGGAGPGTEGSAGDALPSDMSPTSLIGGGLIAGDALAALMLGMIGLAATLLSGPAG